LIVIYFFTAFDNESFYTDIWERFTSLQLLIETRGFFTTFDSDLYFVTRTIPLDTFFHPALICTDESIGGRVRFLFSVFDGLCEYARVRHLKYVEVLNEADFYGNGRNEKTDISLRSRIRSRFTMTQRSAMQVESRIF